MLFNENILKGKYNNLENQKQAFKQTKELLKKEEELEIARAVEPIKEKFQKQKDLINKQIGEIRNYQNSICQYSVFNITDLAKILCYLLSFKENEEFVYRIVSNKVKIIKDNNSVKYLKDKIFKEQILVKKLKAQDYYESKYFTDPLEILVNDGDCLILGKERKHQDYKVYTLINDSLVCNINYGKYLYLKDFLDNVIYYRIQNHLKNF